MSRRPLRHSVRPTNAQLIDVPASVFPPTTGAYDVPQSSVFITIPSTHPSPSIFWTQPVVRPATQINNRLPNRNRSPPATVQAWHERHRQCSRRKTPNFSKCLDKKNTYTCNSKNAHNSCKPNKTVRLSNPQTDYNPCSEHVAPPDHQCDRKKQKVLRLMVLMLVVGMALRTHRHQIIYATWFATTHDVHKYELHQQESCIVFSVMATHRSPGVTLLPQLPP